MGLVEPLAEFTHWEAHSLRASGQFGGQQLFQLLQPLLQRRVLGFQLADLLVFLGAQFAQGVHGERFEAGDAHGQHAVGTCGDPLGQILPALPAR